jgi:hypothetical protein
MNKQTTEQINSNTNVSPEDLIKINSYVTKYVNTGIEPTEEDKQEMLILVKKYNIKINNNPRPIISRFAKTHKNPRAESGKGISYVRSQPKELSKGAVKKAATRARRLANIAKHS